MALIFNFSLDLFKLQGGLDSTPQPNPQLDRSLVFNSFVCLLRRCFVSYPQILSGPELLFSPSECVSSSVNKGIRIEFLF